MGVTASASEPGAPASPQRTLHVAVVVTSSVVPRWHATLLARLAESGRFRVTPLQAGASVPRPRQPTAFRLYEWIDGRLFRKPGDALEPVRLREHPSPVPDPPEACDVVVALTSVSSADLAAVARFGVWTVSHVREPELFWETFARDVYETRLEALLADGERRILYQSYGASDVASLRRARSVACWKACSAILDRLTDLQLRGAESMRSRPPADPSVHPPPKFPAAAAVLRHGARAVGGVLGRRARRTLFGADWFVALRTTTRPRLVDELGAAPDGFVALESPPDTAYADPFVFDHAGGRYVFLEEYHRRTGRGRLACARLDEAGRPLDGPQPILARPYHLSYPFVFRHDGSIYLLPESAENRTVELYRAVDFPRRWRLEHVLLRGARAVDPTLLEHDGRLWLFLNIAGTGASLDDDLHLFSAACLEGPWEPHPENPVVSDVRSARPAGRLFVHEGRLIRPAQDCSRAYGSALVFNRVDLLTRDAYRETVVGRMEPTWVPGLSATHTYTFAGGVEAIDGIRPRLRPSLERVARRNRRRGRSR
jgi:hypothetical protein